MHYKQLNLEDIKHNFSKQILIDLRNLDINVRCGFKKRKLFFIILKGYSALNLISL
jgi:hypothetical protein